MAPSHAACLCLHLALHTTPAAGKGCFLPDVQVTLVDGSTKALQDIRPGDSVLSWDEDAQRPAPSSVQATPTFQRLPSELVEVSLPHARLVTTDDHPFWSKAQGSLVSFDPNKTAHEYGLQARLFGAVEELEGPQIGGVAVAATWRSLAGDFSNFLHSEGRRLRSGAVNVDANVNQMQVNANVTANLDSNGTVKVMVMTLCLEPYHWFFVHGVRVHNKGCFLKTAEVLMADGQRKQLQEIRPGDAVASFDENRGTASMSLVVAPRQFRRRLSELVELDLPHTTLRVTEDHPFWSRRQQSLVSAQPARTMQEYQLTAKPLEQGEELEDLNLQGVEVRAVRAVRAVSLTGRVDALDALNGLNVSARRRLSVRGDSEMAQTWTQTHTLDAAESEVEVEVEVEVMTLCLQPHHWFFVHGVRVHNKGGCFAPWVRVLLSNGTYVPLSKVRPSDKVVSWDEERDVAAEGAVLSVESFPVTEMVEMELWAAASSPLPLLPLLPLAAPGRLPSGLKDKDDNDNDNGNDKDNGHENTEDDENGSGSGRGKGKGKRLVLTPDHPVYSVRHGGIVSLNPSRTWENYGISAGQMLKTELLRHHAGHDVEAIVRPYREQLPTAVMTLHLDRHHWFYAEGVRVHNKGGGGGGGGFGSSGPRYVSRSSFSSRHTYTGVIISTSRRRRGIWEDDPDGCDIAADYAYKCTQLSLDMATCELCNECTSQECLSSIPGCSEFLASTYTGCLQPADYTEDFIFFGLMTVLTCGFCYYLFGGDSVGSLEEARLKLTEFAQNGHGVGRCSWSGQYSESCTSKPTQYEWTADSSGRFSGYSKDDDGRAAVEGAFNWPADRDSGQIAWKETWENGDNVLEVAGTISKNSANGMMFIQAKYMSTLDVSGSVRLQGQQAPSWFNVIFGGGQTEQQSEARPLLRWWPF